MQRHIKKLQENRCIQTVSYVDIGFFYVLFYVSKDRGLGVHHLSIRAGDVRALNSNVIFPKKKHDIHNISRSTCCVCAKISLSYLIYVCLQTPFCSVCKPNSPSLTPF